MSNYQIKDNHILAEYDSNGNSITQDDLNNKFKKDIEDLKANGGGGGGLSPVDREILNKVPVLESQLDEISNKRVVIRNDIYNTTFKANDKVDVNFIRRKHINNFTKYYQKQTEVRGFSLECQGDSVTWGLVTGSEGKPVQSASPYPKALTWALNGDIWWNLVIDNHGISGQRADEGLIAWNEYQKEYDVVMIMYGINDHNARHSIETFISNMEQIIVQKILQGRHVIVLSPPRHMDNIGYLQGTRRYSEPLKKLAEMYCCPYIDTVELLSDIGGNYYNDTAHLSDSGYSMLGSRLASIFMGEGGAYNPVKVKNGSVLLTRNTEDGIAYNIYDAKLTKVEKTNVGTPNETKDGYANNTSTVIQMQPNAKIYYTFYSEVDNLYFMPNCILENGAGLEIDLDYGAGNVDNTIDNVVFENNSQSFDMGRKVIPSSFTDRNITKQICINRYKEVAPRINRKGWHSVRIKATGTGNVQFLGCTFMDFDTLNLYQNKKSSNINQIITTSNSIATTDILYDTLLNTFGYNYTSIWGNTAYDFPLRITINNAGQSVNEYCVCLGSNDGNARIQLVKQTKWVDMPSERTIDSIVVDKTNKKFTINYGGVLTQMSNLLITPY